MTHADRSTTNNTPDRQEVANEFARLAALLYGPTGTQTGYRAGVEWHPAGVLIEQLVADLTIVHALPKVGGTTIAATLNRHPAVRPEALHLHYLSDRGLADLEYQIAECTHPNVRFLRAQLSQGHGARALLAANRALRASGLAPVVRKPFLIAGVREPVALYLSLAFEGWALGGEPNALDAELLHSWVTSDPLGTIWDDWFTDELGAMSSVDVYDRPFPTDRGWDVYESDAARVLVVRQENLDRLPEALGALYGLDPTTFVVETCNVGSEKVYADQYERAKRALRLTEPEQDRMYAARWVRHFYTAEEIAGFRRRWSAERGAPAPAARPEPAKGRPAPTRPDAAPHVGVCRPCPHCADRLNAIPGLRHTCTDQAEQIDRLHAACGTLHEVIAQQATALAAQQAALTAQQAALEADPLRVLARRLFPRPLRALLRRILRPSGREARPG